MAIVINGRRGSINGGEARWDEVDILCDNEDEILAFGSGKGHVIEEGPEPNAVRVKPLRGSTAHTAGFKEIYELSPSWIWTKV